MDGRDEEMRFLAWEHSLPWALEVEKVPAAHFAEEKKTERCFAIYVLGFYALALSAYGQLSEEER